MLLEHKTQSHNFISYNQLSLAKCNNIVSKHLAVTPPLIEDVTLPPYRRYIEDLSTCFSWNSTGSSREKDTPQNQSFSKKLTVDFTTFKSMFLQ